ncbi:MAG: hypothetical protein S0880_11375 [Actinomycetota bacterium]|nr:hypothetical protein [Actinomycetota bacterium]
MLRLVSLFGGLVLFGTSMALMVRSDLGLNPWDVLHQGIAERTGVRFGWVVIGVGALVLALWVPLRERPGFGTVANAIVVGLAADAVLAVLESPDALPARTGLLVAGIVLNAVATSLYIGAGLGPGPRDGLMTGLAKRGLRVGRVRTAIEIIVLAVGWVLGGTVGVGTVAYALAIGPLVQRLLPVLSVHRPRPTDVATARS